MNYTFYIKLVALYTWIVFALVLLLSPMPPSEPSEIISMPDKLAHAFIFGILSFLIYIILMDEHIKVVFNPSKKKKTKAIFKNFFYGYKNFFYSNVYLTAFTLSALFSYAIEEVQRYIPGRSSEFVDFLASLIGISLVLIFLYGDNK